MAKDLSTPLKQNVKTGLPLSDTLVSEFPGTLDVAPNVDVIDATMGRAELTYLLAGPPRLGADGTNENDFGFLGVTQDFNISDSLDVLPIKALGTERNILISTQSPKQLSVSKFLFSRESLLRTMLSYYLSNSTDTAALKEAFGYDGDLPTSGLDNTIISGILEQASNALDGNIVDQPSITLTNFLARAPIGLLIFSANKQGSIVLAKYAEGCKIQNLNEVMSSSSPMIQQSLTLICDRILPVKVSQIEQWFGISTIKS